MSGTQPNEANRNGARLTFTNAGRLVVAAGAALLAMGTVLSWLAAILVGWAVLAAVLASAGAALKRGPPNPRMELRHPLHAQEPCLLVLAGSDGQVRWAGAQWRHLPAALPHTPRNPGMQTFPDLELRRQDSLGWWQVEWRRPGPEATVLPSRLELVRTGREARSVTAALRGASGGGAMRDRSDPEGLRAWLDGSDGRFIDWKASSRFETILEKEFVRMRELDAEVLLDATAAARRPDGPGRRSPSEVGLAASLLMVAWCRAQRCRVNVTVAGDSASLRTEVTSTGGTEMHRILSNVPGPLPGTVETPDDAAAPTPFEAAIRQLRGNATKPGLVRAVAGLPTRPDESAIFLVSPLDVAPRVVGEIARAGRSFAHRILIQVEDLEGSATDADGLEWAYQRAMRRRRNAAQLARDGWITVEAPPGLRAPDLLEAVAGGAE